MGIFSGLFRSRDKPQNRTTGSAYSFFFGSNSAGKRVNERSAIKNFRNAPSPIYTEIFNDIFGDG